nr:hypothetical protein [uncultured Chryseobacterium sp.]
MMFEKIRELLNTVESSASELIIKEYVPILYFGDLQNSKIATVGLNPSDREYYDTKGKSSNRFLSKQSLNVSSWNEISRDEILKVKTSFDFYFSNKPYKSWFNRLEDLLTESEFSYYFPYNNMVHLDIIPVATKSKWGNLSISDKDSLITSFGSYLEYLIMESNIEICILNGQGVVDNFQKVFKQTIHKERVIEWDIKTKNKVVKGNCYKITVNQHNKKILILGYNHNIQSSFGVSKDLVISIRKWIKNEISNFYEK